MPNRTTRRWWATRSLIFRLIGNDMYWHMREGGRALAVERGMALHKMIRLITIGTAGGGYLNFMGNEFGHPEWIDFPREGNDWSHAYARRQWHLVDDPGLKYRRLAEFDRDMIALVKRSQLLRLAGPHLLHEHDDDKVIAFRRGRLVFVFNFHPHASPVDYRIAAPAGKYRMVLDSDAPAYGGFGRLTPGQEHLTLYEGGRDVLSLYLPTRTALVLQPLA